ncbi:cytoplasmic protein [Saccharibacillus sp. O16]|nr:cytoplasmic protein [Saccharibacillus sp. O16]
MSKLLQDLLEPSGGALRPQPLEPLKITSGRVVACDPLTSPLEAFELEVKPGTYPVYAWHSEHHGVIAGAELRLADNKPVRWELAVRPGQDRSTLKEDEIFGYPVDAGIGSFADEDALHALQSLDERLQEELGDEYVSLYDDLVADVLEEHDNVWGNLVTDEETGLNVILFTSGDGDGVYASYWGIDENDEVVSLLTDFRVLEQD